MAELDSDPRVGQQPRQASSEFGVVCICIATCRRPVHLEATLESLVALRFTREPPPRIRLVVVENDVEELGRPVVDAMRERMPWPVDYRVEPQRGISFARNTLVRLALEADAELIAFIDDDELAEPQWLDELLKVRCEKQADVVLGPVLPRFESPPPRWLAPTFDRARHETGSAVDAADFRTGNVLLDVRVLRELEPPFDPAFALTGGSDACLGRELERRGVRFFWTDEAIIHETVPPSRATVGWFVRRRFRTGMALAMIRAKLQGRLRGSVTVLVRAVGAIVYGLLAASKVFVSGRRGLLEGLGVAIFGIGGLFGLLGGRFSEYARPDPAKQRDRRD